MLEEGIDGRLLCLPRVLFVGESLNPLQPTANERLLLQWVASGYLPHEIARHMKITPNEVGRRIRTLYRKLQYDQRAGSLTLQ